MTTPSFFVERERSLARLTRESLVGTFHVRVVRLLRSFLFDEYVVPVRARLVLPRFFHESSTKLPGGFVEPSPVQNLQPVSLRHERQLRVRHVQEIALERHAQHREVRDVLLELRDVIEICGEIGRVVRGRVAGGRLRSVGMGGAGRGGTW